MNIREMSGKDKVEVLEMMKIFYDSPAVTVTASEEVLTKDIEDCISDLPFVEGYILEEDGMIAGYTMVAKSYSTEYGGICLWIEDIYIKPEFQGKGFVGQFFRYLETKYDKQVVRYRLEVEKSNENALRAYKKNGYHIANYVEMTKEMSL